MERDDLFKGVFLAIVLFVVMILLTFVALIIAPFSPVKAADGDGKGDGGEGGHHFEITDDMIALPTVSLTYLDKNGFYNYIDLYSDTYLEASGHISVLTPYHYRQRFSNLTVALFIGSDEPFTFYNDSKMYLSEYSHEYGFYYLSVSSFSQSGSLDEYSVIGSCTVEIEDDDVFTNFVDWFAENVDWTKNNFYIGEYSADGSLGYQPDLDSARESSLAALVNFKADNSINCSWDGLDGATAIDFDTGERIEATTNNAFVAFEFGISSFANPGKVSNVVTYDKYISVSKGSMSVNVNNILNSSSSYLLYVKATPYTYSNDDITGRLRKGYSSYVYFNSDGSSSWIDQTKDNISSSHGHRRGDVDLPDFYLKDVVMKNGFLSNINQTMSDIFSLGKVTIFWTGTTKDSDLMFIPDDDTLVVATYIVMNPDYSYSVKTYDTCTIGDGKIYIDYNKLITESENNDFVWDGDIWLTPCYKKDAIFYMGEPTVVTIYDGKVENWGTNEDGSIKKDDVTSNSGNGSSGDSSSDLLLYGNRFVSFIRSLISSLGALPALFTTVFSFLPSIYVESLGVLLVVLLILRILGR